MVTIQAVSENNGWRVVSGVRRFEVALETQGYAPARDITTGKVIEITRQPDGRIVTIEDVVAS